MNKLKLEGVLNLDLLFSLRMSALKTFCVLASS